MSEKIIRNVELVTIHSGETFEAPYVDLERNLFWFSSKLTSKGVPHKAARGHDLVHWKKPWRAGEFSEAGHYAILDKLDANGEADANLLRKRVEEAQEALDRAKTALFEHYAGPKPPPITSEEVQL